MSDNKENGIVVLGAGQKSTLYNLAQTLIDKTPNIFSDPEIERAKSLCGKSIVEIESRFENRKITYEERNRLIAPYTLKMEELALQNLIWEKEHKTKHYYVKRLGKVQELLLNFDSNEIDGKYREYVEALKDEVVYMLTNQMDIAKQTLRVARLRGQSIKNGSVSNEIQSNILTTMQMSEQEDIQHDTNAQLVELKGVLKEDRSSIVKQWTVATLMGAKPLGLLGMIYPEVYINTTEQAKTK